METVIVPRGRFPHPVGEQNLDLPALMRIVARAKGAGRDLVVDYGHASLVPGEPAQAAGWVKTPSMRVTADGIVADIQWTPEAEEAVASSRYRFLSPVLEMRAGAITGLYNVGLTNNPNIDAMPPLSNQKLSEETQTMDETVKTAVRAAMGMAPDAPDELVAEAFASLFPGGCPPTPLAEALGEELLTGLSLAADAEDELIKEAIEGIADKTPVSLAETLGEEALASLGLEARAAAAEIVAAITRLGADSAAMKESAVERAVNDAVAAGRLAPRLAGWAKGLARKNPEALTAYLVNAGPAVPLGGLITPHRADTEPVDSAEASLCRSLGVTVEEYRRFNRS